jgi:D-threo-aldose 1-dehydrogenase
MRQPLPSRRLGSRSQPGVTATAVGFGCGPRAGLMVGAGTGEQASAVATALESGIGFFDTAELYGDGSSELNLANALDAAHPLEPVTLSTKVRLTDPRAGAAEVRAHVEASLRRLRRSSIDLLFFHNRLVDDVCAERPIHAPGPAVTSAEFLRPGGPWEAMSELREQGLVRAVGLTGPRSDLASMQRVLQNVDVDVVTVEYHLLALGAGERWSEVGSDGPWSELAAAARGSGTSMLALRALGGGALVRPPAAETNPVAAEFHRLCARHACPPDRAAWWFATATGPGPVLGGFRSAADAVAAAAGARGDGVSPELRTGLLALADSTVS